MKLDVRRRTLPLETVVSFLTIDIPQRTHVGFGPRGDLDAATQAGLGGTPLVQELLHRQWYAIAMNMPRSSCPHLDHSMQRR